MRLRVEMMREVDTPRQSLDRVSQFLHEGIIRGSSIALRVMTVFRAVSMIGGYSRSGCARYIIPPAPSAAIDLIDLDRRFLGNGDRKSALRSWR